MTQPIGGATATTAINITYVDNELYIFATGSDQFASRELFHYKSGYGDKMNVTIVPQHVLPAGSYTLSFVGVNWGGEPAFSLSLTSGGSTTAVPVTCQPGNGVVWTANIAISV